MISYGDIKSGEAALPVAKPDVNSIPLLIDRASKRLSEAKTSAEVLEAKAAAELALHYAKVTKAANESHADCLRIITRAEIRMAGEIDRGQKTGEVASQDHHGKGVQASVPGSDTQERPVTMAELGVSRQRVNEWRKVAEAGEEKVDQAISDALAEGRAPTKSDIHRAAGIVKDKPKSDEDHQFEELQRAWNVAGEGARVQFLVANNLQFQAKASEDNGATGKATMRRADCMTGEVSRVDAGRMASATSEGMDVTAGETASNSPSAPPAEAAPASPKPPAHAGAVDNFSRSAISAGSDGNPSKPSPAAGCAKMEGAATIAPDRPDAKSVSVEAEAGQAVTNSHRWSKLRPHCLNPECCAGMGREHCHACKKAMADREAA